jgi:hypothetical protein
MNQFIEWITQPWPWYVAGPIIGLTVPALLIVGNKSFGISSSLRHVCAACVPAGIPFFTYNWKKEMWNLLFVLGILIGGFIASIFLANPNEIVIAEQTQQELAEIGITDFSGLLPSDIFCIVSVNLPRINPAGISSPINILFSILPLLIILFPVIVAECFFIISSDLLNFPLTNPIGISSSRNNLISLTPLL